MDRLRKSPSRLAAISEMKQSKKTIEPPKSPGRTKSPGRPKNPAGSASPSRGRSPARKKSPVRQKSPGRTKSPARPKSPARTKSPGRKAAKSPSRKPKSPSRVQNSVSAESNIAVTYDRISTTPIRDLKQRTPIKENIPDIPSSESLMERGDANVGIRNRFSHSPSLISNFSEGSTRIITRRSRLRTTEQVDLLSSEIRKNNIQEEVKRILETNHLLPDNEAETVQQEFGGVFGVILLMVFIPLFVLGLQLTCVNKDKCKAYNFYLSDKLNFYFDPFATAFFGGFLIWEILLSIIPLNKKVNGIAPKNSNLQYRCSGAVNALFTLIVVGLLHYYSYPVAIIVKLSVQLLNCAIVLGIVFSIVLYIKGGRPGAQKNGHANSGNFFYDFFVGREINPRFGILDVKQALFRIAVVGALVYDAAVILRAIDNKHWSNYPITLIVLTGLQSLVLFDFLIFEENFLSSFFMQHEGTGFMLVISCFIFPFFITIIPKFLIMNSIELNYYFLAAIAISYIAAFLLYRISTNQKSNCRKYQTTNLATVLTATDKKLLCGGLWGFVRHPNYLGVILMYWILAASATTCHVAPYLVALASTLVLIFRAIRNSKRCQYVYLSVWDRYKQGVKYHLIPRVF